MPRYIDVEWLMEKIREREYPLDYDPLTTSYGLSTLGILRILEEAPTVSPDDVRGKGKWEHKEVFGVEETTIEQMQSARCSSCGKYHTTPFSYYFSKYNYCPNCGAKMEVSGDA